MDIDMVEVQHKRFNVMRERVGLNMPTERGTNQIVLPKHVDR